MGARVKRGCFGQRVQDAVQRSVLVSDLCQRGGHLDDEPVSQHVPVWVVGRFEQVRGRVGGDDLCFGTDGVG